MDAIPNEFVRTITEAFGDDGVDWLNHLPSIISEYALRWSLTVMPPFEPLSYNYVAPVIRADGADAVLKLGVPDSERLMEVESLRIFDGRGAVRLLDSNQEQGVMLLERLKPGTPLSSYADDEKATSIAAQVMRQLWTPAPREHSFPTMAYLATEMYRLREHFRENKGPFPATLVDLAENLFEELVDSIDDQTLLHGDLHHSNILAAERQPWLAIDPKGLVGDPAYEVGALLRNPMPQLLNGPQPDRVIARRIDQLAQELGFERDRLIGWGLVHTMLSAWWRFELHGDGWEPAVACAEILAALV